MCESAWNWQSKNPYGYEDGPGKEGDATDVLLGISSVAD